MTGSSDFQPFAFVCTRFSFYTIRIQAEQSGYIHLLAVLDIALCISFVCLWSPS